MIKTLLRGIVSLGFLGLLFYLMREDFPEILRALKGINRPLFLIAVLISLSTVIILARRLQLIFGAEGVGLKFGESSNLTFIGFFFNNFLPTSVGGDLVKALCASRVTRQPVKSVTSVLMDRIFGLFTFILIPSVSFLFFLKEIKNTAIPLMIYSFLAFSVFFFFLIFNRRIARRFSFVQGLLHRVQLGEKVKKIYEGLHAFRHRRLVMAQAMALSILGQCLGIVMLYVMSISMGARASILYFFLLVPIVHLLSMLPSLNGLGIREGAYIYFLSPYIGKEYAAALSVLYLLILFFFSVIGGVIYLIRHDYHIRFKEVAVPS
ncbi:MAG: flippase-like domain-containing protein [Candidatus Omnitrophica bacterium]|nr:flippase-like domain-containing protein [Candidatus Omnitrophota bacterium]